MLFPLTPAASPVATADIGRSFFDAARVAEAAGEAQREGRRRRCSRQTRVVVTPEECRGRFLAGDRVCINEFHGRCSTGALEVDKLSEDDMARGNCRNPACPNHDERVRLVARGLCSKCYPKVLKGLIPDPDAMPDSVAGPTTPGDTVVVQVEHETAGCPAEEHGSRSADEVQEPSTPEVVDQAREESADSDPVKDFDASVPFSLAGLTFLPPPEPRRARKAPLVAIKKRGLSLRVGVVEQLSLRDYFCAKVCPSVDGRALAIKFYREAHDGAVRLRGSSERGGGLNLAAETITSLHPGLIGQEAPMESTDVRDWFVVRFGGEAA